MADTIIATNVVKRYGTLTAVDGVSLSVGHGEFFGILGPNGAGKTTLLEMIEGLREPDSGDVTVLGEPVWPRNSKLLPRIGVQLQASSFFERLTAREQLQHLRRAVRHAARPGRRDAGDGRADRQGAAPGPRSSPAARRSGCPSPAR